MNIEKLKNLLRRAVLVVEYRGWDIDTEDGSFATTDINEILALEAALCDALNADSDDARILDLAPKIEEIASDFIPIENGTNRYGLDVGYFRKTINRELNGSLGNFRPDELARVFARLSKTADSNVMKEPEFQ